MSRRIIAKTWNLARLSARRAGVSPAQGRRDILLGAGQAGRLPYFAVLVAVFEMAVLGADVPGKKEPQFTGADRAHWAFQRVQRPAVPKTSIPISYPIDAFARVVLDSKGLKPNPAATPRERIRRAYFDLIGLPPAPEEIAAFEKDPTPEAWTRVVEHLLSLPQYGERWGRHWLDVARFAQSNGYERDGEKPEAWRYRDYVVKSFNEDKPYDQFIREQIAGDELDPVTLDSIVATGFQRLGVWDDEPDDKRMAEFDELDDVLSTTGSAFLGLTVGCARCHDHKFDPMPQTDYYQLLSFFRNIRLSEAARYALDSPNYVPLVEAAKVTEWQAAQEARLQALKEQLAAAKDDGERQKLSSQMQGVRGEKPPFPFALAVREREGQPPPTHVLIRGNAGSVGPEVKPAFLSALEAGTPRMTPPLAGVASSGRRRALADWIASPDNPLTARVMVNRIWQHHFGSGLVKTASDFGRAGSPPSHPQLLDWLAAEFVAGGWSIKKLHKTILLSQTYQMSSRTENQKAAALDPGNELLWRQNLRRLEAEALRDTLMAISGKLNPKMGGRGFFPRLSGEVLAGQSRPGLDWEISSDEELSRRSLYAYVRRTMPVPMLDAFDYSNTTSPLSERPTTTVAPQSLLLLNDEFLQEQAAGLANRVGHQIDASQPGAFIRRGFQLAVGREPTSRERQLSLDFIQRQQRAFATLTARLTFRPDVPTSLAVSYFDKLPAGRFLLGPGAGWTYHRGRWSGAYEGIRTVDRERGPFALSSAAGFSNGVIEVKILFHTACESAGFLFRASTNGDQLQGYEVAFEPREQRIALWRHGGETVRLAGIPASIPTGRSTPMRIEARDGHLRIAWGTERVWDVTDPKPIPGAGRVGVRTWGSAMSVDELVLSPEGLAPITVRDESSQSPERRAYEAFALLLLNLNEVVYVD